MDSIYCDSDSTDEIRRKYLNEGQLFVYSPRPGSIALCKFARELIEEAFFPLDSRQAQHHLSVEK